MNALMQTAQEALDVAKFSQLEALLNRSQMYTQFLTEQVRHTTLLVPAHTLAGLLLARIRCVTGPAYVLLLMLPCT